MSAFNPREIAIAIWSLVLIVGTLSLKGVRKNLWGLVKTALFSKLNVVWISLAAYTALVILALEKLGLWTTVHLKDTVVWFVFGAVTYPFQFHDPEKAPRVWRVLLRNGVSILLIAEVLLQTYTFSLATELVLVPAITLLALVGVVAEMKEEHKPVARALGAVQGVVGLSLLLVVVMRALADSERAFVPALMAALIVVVLTVASYPYVLGLRIAFAHESMLWRIGWKTQVSRRFQHYAALQIMRYLGWRATAVAPFVRRNAIALNAVVDRDSLKALLDADEAASRDNFPPVPPAS